MFHWFGFRTRPRERCICWFGKAGVNHIQKSDAFRIRRTAQTKFPAGNCNQTHRNTNKETRIRRIAQIPRPPMTNTKCGFRIRHKTPPLLLLHLTISTLLNHDNANSESGTLGRIDFRPPCPKTLPQYCEIRTRHMPHKNSHIITIHPPPPVNAPTLPHGKYCTIHWISTKGHTMPRTDLRGIATAKFTWPANCHRTQANWHAPQPNFKILHQKCGSNSNLTNLERWPPCSRARRILWNTVYYTRLQATGRALTHLIDQLICIASLWIRCLATFRI